MKRAAAALALLFACSGEPAPPPEAPVALQAAVAIEPPRLRVGDVARIEVSVVTPPGHRVRPLEPPAAVAGLWLLDAERLPVEVNGARLVHRTQIRVRARELGAFAWPALAIQVEHPNGAASTLATEERPIEVVSTLTNPTEQVKPFPYRLPTAAASGPTPLSAAVAGALAALSAVALLALVRRTRRRAHLRRALAAQIAASQPWVAALADLAAARARAGTEWRDAGGEGARALRRYVAQRFAVPAVESSPSEELAGLRAPPLLASHWREAVACLAALDSDRFRALAAAEAPARVRDALDAALHLVRITSPAGEPGSDA